MPMKEWRLLARDLTFYIRGEADVAAADWHSDPWLYAIDWSYQLAREPDYFAPKDLEGIPLRQYRAPLGMRYLPSRIATYGLTHWNLWRRTGGEHHRQEFLTVVAWLRRSERDGRFEHDFDAAGMPAGWISCISQGEAISALTRAYTLTGDAGYLAAAHRANHWLTLPEEQGGLLSRLPDGSLFVEEYPGSPIRHVLNGCLYAALGIADLCRADPTDRAVADFFSELMRGVASNISAWDANGWSVYDYASGTSQRRNLNTMTYQLLQVAQLAFLADASGELALREASQRWARAVGRPSTRLRALMRKIAYRLHARW